MLRSPLALLLSALLLGACATAPASRFYLLDPLAVAPTEKTVATDYRLGIGTISLPDYLNRQQLVIRGAGGRLLIRDGERWGEPLEDSVRRVLGENLGRLLGPGKLVFLPAPSGITVNNRLQLEITAFEASADNEVRLNARWSLSRTQGVSTLRESRIVLAMKADDASAMVTAMNQALLQLASEIAAESSGVGQLTQTR
ncbi:membrane integrity-associated transporter subunit PqiC [Azonexus sp.]|uniref:PqiC family protein n=1 Tax=Azonexus sp. TaxID=1872668 RepID=UPI0027BA3E8A|nr:PqiC family protein [Azonexus sp.]